MKVLIIEDEPVAARSLIKMLKGFKGDHIEILDHLTSIIDSVNFLSHTPEVDLIFLDIELSDGKSFEIFEEVEVATPIIFTTAYDKYTLEAFKLNSIDYLLKPIHQEDLNDAIEKMMRYQPPQKQKSLLSLLQQDTYKCRFLVKTGRGFQSVNVSDIAYFFCEHKLTYIMTFEGKKYAIDKPLEQLLGLLDPIEFCRINRSFIISNKCIQKVEPYFNNRMIIQVTPKFHQDVLVNRSFVKDFKSWMDL